MNFLASVTLHTKMQFLKLAKNKKVETFSIQLGEKRKVNFLQNEYIIQAQAYKIDGNYRIRILK